MKKSSKAKNPKINKEYSWEDCNCEYHKDKKKSLIRANTSKYEVVA